MKKGFEPSADTNTQAELTELIIKGHTQHLNSRPVEGIGKQDPAIQEAVFATNFATKAEGNHEVAMAAAFDKVGNATTQYLGDITAANFAPLLPAPGPSRTAIETAGLTDACDATKSPLERHLALLKTKAKVDTLPAGTADFLKAQLDEVYSSPKRLVTEIQGKLLDGVLSDIGSVAPGTLPPELASLNVAHLSSEINASLKNTGKLETQSIERLSTIIAALPDAAMRKNAFESLRGAVMLESLRGIALKAAGSETDPKYNQYLMTLANKFIFRAGGINSDALGKLLADTLYKKAEGSEAISEGIATNAQLKDYLTELLNTTFPGTAVEAELKVNGLSSKGEAFGKIHEQLGIVRRGAEASEWFALKGRPPADKETYLVANFGYTAGSKELSDAVTRLDTLLAAGTGGAVTLVDAITAASTNATTDLGDRYTNLMRAQRNYIERGGELAEVERNSETIDANRFITAIQTQANAEVGVAEGGVATDRNRVLSVEEQRATVLADYEALGAKTGLRGWVDRIKRVLPRIAKGVGLMALATVGAAIPVVAGPLAIGLAAARVMGVISTVKMGIPVIKNAIASKNWKAGVAAGLAIGVNAAVSLLVPSPMGYGITLIGEALGTELYADRQLVKEVQAVKTSHAAYETALTTKLGALNMADAADSEFLTKLARSINANVVTTAGTGAIDAAATVAAIQAKRAAAHTDKNMTILRSFSQVMEERMTAERDTLNTENLNTRRIYDEAQQVVTAYAVASSATKLGFGIGRGFAAGYESGGILGGIAGAFGFANAFEKSESLEKAEAYSEVRNELEADFDKHATELGIAHDGHNITGLIESPDGTDYAVVDLDGDTSTPEMFVNVDNMNLDTPSSADLDFSNAHFGHLSSDIDLFKSQVSLMTGTPLSNVQVMNTPSDGSTVAALATPQGQFVLLADELGELSVHTLSSLEGSSTIVDGTTGTVAVAGDSQWSLIEKTLRASYPGLTDQQVWTATANAMNEAGTSEVYSQVFEHRTPDISGGAIQTGDRITITDIREMAPNTFASLPGNPIEGASTVTSIPGGAETVLSDNLSLGIPEVNGVIVFDLEGSNHTLYGSFTPGTPPGAGDIGGGNAAAGATSTTQTTSSTPAASDAPAPQAQTTTTFGYNTGDAQGVNMATDTPTDIGGGNVDSAAPGVTTTEITPNAENGTPIDTITINDPGIGGHYTIYEDTVSKVIVEQRLYGAPAFELDPKTHDILNIDPGHSITYKSPDGAVHTLEASGPIKLEFVGSEGHPIDVASGQQSILSATADTLTGLTHDVEGAQGQFARIDSAMNELGQDLSGLSSSTPYFDSGFGGSADFPIYEANYTTTDGSPAFLGGFSVSQTDGSNILVPYDNVIKLGPGYITHLDPLTNNVVTTNGTNIIGVGTTWHMDNTINNVVHDAPVQFQFNPNGTIGVLPVENPWWNSSEYGPTLPDVQGVQTTPTPQPIPVP